MRLISKKEFCLTIGVIIMLNLSGCSGFEFKKYISKDNRINLSLDYIKDWQYSETRGSYGSYAQVMFFPFKKGQKSSRAIMTVTVKDGLKMQPASPTLDTLIADLLTKRMQSKDAKVLSKTKMRILGTDAVAIELSYLTLENLLDVSSKLISVKEKVIILKSGNSYYFLRFSDSSEEFDKYNSAFTHMIESMSLK